MEIYVASFAGLLSSLLLAAVYLADRYEAEPIELIQNSFLTGMAGQLILILGASALDGHVLWSGPWLLLTVTAVALVLPLRLVGEDEVDERFDGIVYTVAAMAGATCVIHLNNLPWVMAASIHRNALAPGAEPDLRDLLILAQTPGVAGELGAGVALVASAVLVGAVVGHARLRGWSTPGSAAAGLTLGLGLMALDLVIGGAVWWRVVLISAAVVTAVALKRRSVFRDRPEPRDREVVLLGLRTILVVFGAALLATVLLQAVVEQPPKIVWNSHVPDAVSGAGH